MTNAKSEDKKQKEKREKDPINIFVMFKKIYPMIFQNSKMYTISWIFVGIAHGISHALGVTVNQFFFDSINDAIGGNRELTYVILMLGLFGAVTILSQVLNGVHNFMSNVMWQKIGGYFTYIINGKCSRIDAVEYENSKRHDDINKASSGANSAIQFVFTTTTIFTFYIPYFLYMAVYMYTLSPILIFAILLVFVPVLISQLIRAPIYAKLEDKAAPIRREFSFYENAVTSKEYFKETRLLGTFGYFRRLFLETLELLNNVSWKAFVKSANIDIALQLISTAGRFGIMYLLFNLLMNGSITIGAFAAVFSSIGMLFGVMEEIIARHIGEITRNFGLIRNFLRFLDIPEKHGCDVDISSDSGIDVSVTNVSFKYPQSEHESLRNVSLHIRSNETIAIVGENGAGKTTLVKLITGVYTPTEGSVKIGGYDTKEVSPQSIYRNISGVFQKYQRYQLTLDENVKISDIENGDATDRVMEQSGVDYRNADTFPLGKDTMLSRDFDGVDLSGGQWQRVAIARGFYRVNGMIVLDEPTAAIDPIEENKIYRKFGEIAKDKTAVIVTHRMASAKIADRIVVMDKGDIADMGSHDDLMSRGGLYADMYNSQSVWYQNKP